MSAIDEKGLPCNLDAERFVLGSILLDDSQFIQVAGVLEPDHFSVEKHRRIFQRIRDLNARGERIDRVTLANELKRHDELESCDGLSYLVSLDDGLPKIFNLDSYARIVKEKALLRRIIFTSQHQINRCLAGAEDPEEILAGAEESLLKLRDQDYRREEMRSPAEIIEAHGGIENLFRPPELGVLTPWPTLNKLTFGLQPGDLIFLGGRPSAGKSTAALQIIHCAASHGIGSLLFSLEMPDKTLVRKLLCMAAHVRLDDFRSGNITAEERWRIVQEIEPLSKLRINSRLIAKGSSIHAEVRRQKAERHIGLVVIDYLQLMEAPAHQQRYVEVGNVSRQLKLAAHEMEIPFLVLCQLSRSSETESRPPSMKDLRESGNLEQDADVVLLLWAPGSRNGEGHPPGYTEMIIAKQRNGEAGRSIEMRFFKDRGRLEELANEQEKASVATFK